MMNVKPTHQSMYEFGGPLGTFFMSISLPCVVYLFAFICNDISGCPIPVLLEPSKFTLDKLKNDIGWHGFSSLFERKVFGYCSAYYTFSLLLHAILPATEVKGCELKHGGRLLYRFNAFSSALITLSLAGMGTYVYGSNFLLWNILWEKFIQIITSNLIIAFFLSVFVYVRSFSIKPDGINHRELAQSGQSGHIVYDWFIGRELNPRVTVPFIGEIDIKSFMELRPGMLLWILLDLAFLVRQYNTYNFVTYSMIFVVGSQMLYCLDALYMEPAILTTMDITTDGFGFMLSFGDLVWLPFTYSIQARYLAMHPIELNTLTLLSVMFTLSLGYYIFRSSNNEKNIFRFNPNNPKVKNLKYITTKSGSKLITSGWWGIARHVNYLGDWILSWSFCLPTGLAGYLIQIDQYDKKIVIPGKAQGWAIPITYFYILYFAILLIHRERRDDEKCFQKYTKDWEKYRRSVPWRIIPYVY